MKKRIVTITLITVLLCAILFVPIPSGVCQDGGSREFTALTYKIVKWNRLISDSIYSSNKVYFFPDNFKTIDELWDIEKVNAIKAFDAKIITISGNSVIVEPFSDEEELNSSDRIMFPKSAIENLGVREGDFVKVSYTGEIKESYPAQLSVTECTFSDRMRNSEYTEEWLTKNEETKWQNNSLFEHITITKIYSNCFFARTVIPMPYEIKLNGKLSDEWCVGDQVICTYENTYYDKINLRCEADMLTIKQSDWQPDPFACYKPVIYLYPEKQTDISVNFNSDVKLTCTYPEYKDGWLVTASPDGTLTDKNGQIFNYLYWEGDINTDFDFSEGFCINGESTAEFLDEALKKLGLTRREANEFIVYWLPLMQNNKYNIISFQSTAYTEAAELEISPSPDTLIRIFMAYKPSEEYIEIPEQALSAPERKGFTAVEWGGTRIN